MGLFGGGKVPKTTTQRVVNDVPDWIKGAAKDTLARGMELTKQPYEAYGGNRLADFNDLQNQSFAGAQNMTVAPQIGQATGYANQAGNYQNVGQDYTGSNVNQYMNPFLQGALAPQIREALAAGNMAQIQNSARAVGMGAFGGSRGALQRSLTEKNTMQNMADINAKGYFDAFNNAQNQFNTQQNRNIQEAQFGNTAKFNAAAQLGALGQTQFNQGLQANELQNKYGAQQQGQAQRGLDIAYDDFNREKNFDYEQVMRAADLVNRVPSGSSTTTSMYGSNPTTAQGLLATGATAYGASQLGGAANGGLMYAAKGGLMYAGGGITSGGITGDDNVAAIVPMLSNEQLKQAYDAAVAMGDPERIRVITEEMQKRGVVAEGGTGQAGLPAMTQLPEVPQEQIAPNSISAMATPDMVNNIVPTQASMANGGIVAFARGGDSSDYEYEREERFPSEETPGIPSEYLRNTLRTADTLDEFDKLQAPIPLTAKQRREAAAENYRDFEELVGTSPYGAMRTKFDDREAKIEEQAKKGTGLAFIEAAGRMLEGRGVAQGLSRALPAFAGSYGQNMKEIARQKDALAEQRFNVDNADYTNRAAGIKGATGEVTAAEAAAGAAFDRKRRALLDRGTVGARLNQTIKPVGSGKGSGSGTKERKLNELTAYANFDELLRQNALLPPEQQKPREQLWKEATNAALSASKMSDIPPGGFRARLELARLDATITAAEEAAVAGQRFRNPAYIEGMSEQNQEKMDAADLAALQTIRARGRNPAAVNPNSSKSDTVPKTAPPGSTLGKTVSGKGREVLDASGKLIGYIKG